MKADACLYARFSPRPKKIRGLAVEIQAGERIELQLDACRAYCAWAGLTPRWEIGEEYTSAFDLDLAERPRGPELIELFKGGCKHIVVAKVDRLFRSLRDGAYWIEDGFPKYGVTLHIADQRGLALRADTADGFMFVVMQLMAPQLEAMRTRERTSSSMLGHQRNGRAMSGHAPYGKTITPEGALLDAPDELAIRAEIFARLKGGCKPTTLAAQLNSEGKFARNGKPWHHAKIQRIYERGEI